MAKSAKLKKIANVLLTVILVFSIILIIFTILLRVMGNNPSFGGFMLYRVSSESMEPELNKGDVILSQEISDVSSLKVGDVITYDGEVGSYAGKSITHMVIKEPYQISGKYYVVTKGIANEVADPVISEDQIVGKMLVKLPIFGAIYSFFITPWGLITSIILIIISFAAEFRHIRNMPQLDELSDEENSDTLDNENNSENSKYIPRHSKK